MFNIDKRKFRHLIYNMLCYFFIAFATVFIFMKVSNHKYIDGSQSINQIYLLDTTQE